MLKQLQASLVVAGFVLAGASTASAQAGQILSGEAAVDRTTDPTESPAAIQTPTPATAVPDTLRHRLTFYFLWGPDNSFSGEMIKASSGVSPAGVPINFSETSYDDVYGRMGLLKFGVGYRISPRSEAQVNLVFERSGGQPVTVGTVGTDNVPVTATFEDYAYWGVEGGQRFFFSKVRLTPYVGYTLGINRFTHANASFAAPATATQPGIVVNNETFFDSSWAFSLAPLGGVLVGVGPVEVMGEVAFRYMGGLSDVDVLSGAGLKDINSDSSRWSFPILFGARLRF
jgi:hypothetical protein